MSEKIIVVREVPEIGQRRVLTFTPKRIENQTFWDGVLDRKCWRINRVSRDVFESVGVDIGELVLCSERHFSAGRLAAFIMPDESKGGVK